MINRLPYIAIGIVCSGGVYSAYQNLGVIYAILLSGLFIGAVMYRLHQAYDDIRELQRRDK